MDVSNNCILYSCISYCCISYFCNLFVLCSFYDFSFKFLSSHCLLGGQLHDSFRETPTTLHDLDRCCYSSAVKLPRHATPPLWVYVRRVSKSYTQNYYKEAFINVNLCDNDIKCL